jgi:molybdate transport system substrate-binding protein
VTRKLEALLAPLAVALLGACGASGNAASPPDTSITVFAASSLQPAFDKIAARLRASQNLTVTFNYAGTQTLTSQLQQGAQADVFASADTAHMTQVDSAGLLAAPSRTFAHNKLEIAVERGNPKGIRTLADLSRAGVVVVLADPSVPAGKYAAQALNNAGVTVHAASLELQVTGVLNKVALGEADAGIVYVSDIVTSGKVDGVAIPDDQNVVADYPIAALKGAANPAGATAFISFVLSTDGQAILKTAGFQGA